VKPHFAVTCFFLARQAFTLNTKLTRIAGSRLARRLNKRFAEHISGVIGCSSLAAGGIARRERALKVARGGCGFARQSMAIRVGFSFLAERSHDWLSAHTRAAPAA
jgi:hypothetical protein